MAVICQSCQQRPATLHLTEIAVGGAVSEVHLCPTCASTHRLHAESLPPSVAVLTSRLHAPAPQVVEPRCAACGLSMADYRQSSVLGCPQCWTHLREPLDALVRRFHDAHQHRGRTPAQHGAEADSSDFAVRRQLELELRQAVNDERFEDAARLRDALESKKKSGKRTSKTVTPP